MSAGSEVTWELRMVHCATVQGFTARRRRGYRIHWLSRFPGITKKCWGMFLQSAAAAEGASRGCSSPENLLPQNPLKRHIFFPLLPLCTTGFAQQFAQDRPFQCCYHDGATLVHSVSVTQC